MTDTLSIEQLLARLERAATTGAMAIACDADGTLWRGDIGETLFLAALERGLFREAARETLAADAAACGARASGDANELARALFDAYYDGRYDEQRAFGMMAWAFAGWSESELTSFSARVLDDFGFDEAVREQTRALLAWAARHDHRVWVVSASPELIVFEAARRLGLPRARVVAMRVAEDDGVLLPALGCPATYAAGKLARLREHTHDALLAALGDSIYDLALLKDALVPVAVDPKPSLRAALDELAGAVVLRV
ncbi:MAG TPA: haloacid dehalogenase-like hydrolase [Polyangiaceae bacterium]|nr:haloacid dehalogenase-like hydrolase [Polyangiaceae bacterium]